MGWYREDAFLSPKKPASYDPVQPGNIGGVEPSPKTMADPAGPKVVEAHCTDPTMIAETRTADADAGLSPVSNKGMGDDESYSPGRQEDGDYEGAPELYQPGDGDANLYTPRES